MDQKPPSTVFQCDNCCVKVLQRQNLKDCREGAEVRVSAALAENPGSVPTAPQSGDSQLL